jgi:hypothetical protein
MERSHRGWIGRALLIALFYAIAGVGLGALAGAAGSHQMVVAWRLAAWVLSAIAFAAHIWIDGVRYGFSCAQTAYHAALASGLGAFALGAGALYHSHRVQNAHPFPPLAMVVWLIMTAIPAFVVAYGVASVFRRYGRSSSNEFTNPTSEPNR